MSKSAIRRHHTRRLMNKWITLNKKHNFDFDSSSLSFGRVFSKDPIDCGNSLCLMCKTHSWLTEHFTAKHNTINFNDYVDEYNDVYPYDS